MASPHPRRQRAIPAGLSHKPLKGLLVRPCQDVGPTLGAAQIRFLELQKVDASLRLGLRLDQLMDDCHPQRLDCLLRELNRACFLGGLLELLQHALQVHLGAA